MAKGNDYAHITALLEPIARGTDRKVWSISLAAIWLPFFTATNVEGQTAIDADVLGAPLRLQKETDGMPKFSKSGRPVIRVAKELSDNIRVVRDNFAAGLVAYASHIKAANPDAYKQQVELAQQAGEPLIAKDIETLNLYTLAVAEAMASQAPVPAEAELVPA